MLLCLISRMVNVLPSDILSLYLGAVGIDYRKYLAGSILGMLLSLITVQVRQYAGLFYLPCFTDARPAAPS